MNMKNNLQKETKTNNNQLDFSLKLIAKTSMIVFIGLVLSKILLYLYRVIIARNFGPEVYGLFSLAFIIIQLFVALFSLGLPDGLLRYISFYMGKKEIDKVKHIFRKSLIIILVSGIISGIFLFLLSDFISIKFFHDPNLIIFLKIFSILIPLWALSNIFITVIRAFERINVYSFFVNILQNAIKLATLVLFILVGINSSKAVIYSFFLGILVTLIGPYLYCKYKLPVIFEKYKMEEKEKNKVTKDLISYSWPIMFLSTLTIIFYWADSFIIGYFKSISDVGIYNAAVPIAMLLGFFPELFMQLFFPLTTKEFSRKRMNVVEELSKQTAKWIFILNLPVFILIILFPGVIINILFGAEYITAVNSLRFLVIGSFFSSIFIISNSLISILGKSKLILTDMLITFTINLFLNILLVPVYGINGAAFSTMISVIILNLLFFFQAKKYSSIIPLKRKMIGIFLIGIISGILLYFIKQFVIINLFTLTLLGLSFVLFYFLLIIITGCLDKNDLMIIKAVKKKIIG